LLRLAGLVRTKDPDMLLSWDTQGAGLGYIVERGANLGSDTSDSNASGQSKLDMAKLLGRLPFCGGQRIMRGETKVGESTPGFFSESTDRRGDQSKGKAKDQPEWTGSGLGVDWDEKVGAGQVAASIVSRSTWFLKNVFSVFPNSITQFL
jgi:hypothetical protein